jgi:Kef-type K+ transport system membrane component KefB
MDIAEILRHILIVLVAAKLAAEVAERVGVPAVVGEILVGIVLGPSVLNAVGAGDEVLRTLGEIGVILLLLEVGMEMDLGELGKVGRASLAVAVVGVVAPMAMGIGALELMGEDFNTALFVGAALTATSVGITARVFGDLRALSTTEARIVLGAAVADDVMGLIVLTVVVRLVTEGSVSVVSVAGIVLVAVAFLVVGGAAGLRIAPPLFAGIERRSRSTGTLVALALAFTLGFAELADAAKLAPIVGAFVAGIALSKAKQSHRIHRELGPVGHLFIPVFFLQIGIDADVTAFVKGSVLVDAAILLAVAAVGKLISPVGAIGTPGDKALIGLGMLPRGEVGLIFATLGLHEGVLGDDLYAALLLVVLVTTLVTPQLLKVRYAQIRSGAAPTSTPPGTPAPDGGWLAVDRDEVRLAAQPPDDEAIAVALAAAIPLARRRPAPGLLDWLADAGARATWTPALTPLLLDVMERGNARSWRFLDTSGVLERALPELAEALRARREPAASLDPLESHRAVSLERLRILDADDPVALEARQLEHIDRLLVASFLADVLDEAGDPSEVTGQVVARLALDAADRAAVVAMVADRDLLEAAVRQPAALSEDRVFELAEHLDDAERARATFVLAALRGASMERWERQRLAELHSLVQEVFSDDALGGVDAWSLAESRRRTAMDVLADDDGPRERVHAAPRPYIVRTQVDAIVRHARLLSPKPVRAPKVEVLPTPTGTQLDIAWQDRPGLLATIAHTLAAERITVDEAVLATWPDGAVLDSFRVQVPHDVDPERLAAALAHADGDVLSSQPLTDVEVVVEQSASPWFSVVEVRADDRPGTFAAIALAFAATGMVIRNASLLTDDGLVIDRFDVTDRTGSKVTDPDVTRLADYLQSGVSLRRRRFGRRPAVRVGSIS